MSNTIASNLTINAGATYSLYVDLHNVHEFSLLVEGTLATSSATTGMDVSYFRGYGPIDPAATAGAVNTKASQPSNSHFDTVGTTVSAGFSASSVSSQTKGVSASLPRNFGDWVLIQIKNKDTSINMTNVSLTVDAR